MGLHGCVRACVVSIISKLCAAVNPFYGADPGFLKSRGGGSILDLGLQAKKRWGPGRGPTLGPMLKRLYIVAQKGERTPWSLPLDPPMHSSPRDN